MQLKFGEKLKALREARGLSQYDLAMLVGKSQDTISYWERSGGAPAGDKLAEICKIFGVSADYLIGLEDGAKNPLLPPIDLIALLRSDQPVTANGVVLNRSAREAIASTVTAFVALIAQPTERGKGEGSQVQAAKSVSEDSFDPRVEALRVCRTYRIEPSEEVVAWLEHQIRTAHRTVEQTEVQQEAR